MPCQDRQQIHNRQSTYKERALIAAVIVGVVTALGQQLSTTFTNITTSLSGS